MNTAFVSAPCSCAYMCAESTYPLGWTVKTYPPAAIKLDGGAAFFNGTVTQLVWRGGEFYAGSNLQAYDEFTLNFEYESDGTWSASGSGKPAAPTADCHSITCSTIPKASYGQWQSINCPCCAGIAECNVAFAINLTP